MKFSGAFTVPAPRAVVYDRLNDAQFFASCVDGVRDLVAVDDGRYTATLETRIAYIKFKFAVEVSFVEKVAPERIVARAEGTPIGVVGRLTSTAAATLSDAADGTAVAYEIDVALAGKLGSIGQPVLKAKAKDMEKSFVKNLNDKFAAGDAGQGGDGGPGGGAGAAGSATEARA
ncbi:SRPBCC domain-containing protein [Rhodoplanes sp. TEM]|uniref:SRPBCC domain-containing protein n=1 Tax=Rhodoplanes tepidamans TaxID=200616 RepID=A0ABT5J6E3_RHOTP|nr:MULTISPECIES: SRPBCC domain-containing protein [Rhodoplanes]MDC7785186.1 SRPBCC domain-containing protein [Rhodoplanes tepidamans]MDC7987136.1 SRPBCC domain-containing protein [Rhodoplanes sp. TEM]MDQ0353443.1 carbon monoxide dehydrogenase subunit G [Rhodoplanes tepidamans]